MSLGIPTSNFIFLVHLDEASGSHCEDELDGLGLGENKKSIHIQSVFVTRIFLLFFKIFKISSKSQFIAWTLMTTFLSWWQLTMEHFNISWGCGPAHGHLHAKNLSSPTSVPTPKTSRILLEKIDCFRDSETETNHIVRTACA